jgi:Family of unknown function (DUF5947)
LADQSPLIQILRRPPDAPAASEPSTVAQWPAVTGRLRQYAAARRQRQSSERCEFCGVDIAAAHAHLVDVPRRMLLCVCRPCYLLFTHDGAGGVRFRAVPERYGLVPELAGAREGWNGLDIPVGLAFLFRNSATGRITAFYPSPAGATESELGLDAWDALVDAAPSLATLAADVEALLVRRTDHGMDALIAPIDACYELVGRIRRAWRGFQGGDEVSREIDEFFARALDRARPAAL